MGVTTSLDRLQVHEADLSGRGEQMTTPTRADVCIVAVAECFRGDGEILANPIGTIPHDRGSAGPSQLRAGPGHDRRLCPAGRRGPSRGTEGDDDLPIEGWNPYRRMFDVVWGGKRHVMMGATQVDQFGNQNIAAIGDNVNLPKVQLLGFRGAPGNTINNPTSYWVPRQSAKVLIESVDVVTGVGYDRAAELSESQRRFHEIRRVVTDLAVLDFETPDHRMRLRSVHPGVSVSDVPGGHRLRSRRRRGGGRESAADRPGAGPDPRRARSRGPGRTGSAVLTHPTLRTALCDLVGVEVPVVQTGNGLGGRAPPGPRRSQAGGLGILAAATMDLAQLESSVREVKESTDRPFGVNLRADAPDVGERIDLLIREGVKVASFALAPQARPHRATPG